MWRKYKLVCTWGWSSNTFYYSDLKTAENCLAWVKRDGGSGKIYICGDNGKFERVVSC